ncbi:hypothetical protein NECAME_04876 [Necator americanus]|uniref:Uncharacterized protein n=1 Tax=Necator americanus TaxID=51031 RepID=W2SNZ8_NECAM|nr:hypothetical protein NECAME_04876 [Necator americanus]ETN70596.1 hypothetical protein NECAME_04876 [Necator americanus]
MSSNHSVHHFCLIRVVLGTSGVFTSFFLLNLEFKGTDDAKGERAYKLFGKLHSACMISVEAIEQNGALSRQNEELIDLIEIEKQGQFDQQLARIQADLDAIEEENMRLEKLLKERESS